MILQAYFLFISGAEIGFILFIILLVFGADKVPEIARGLGKAMRQVKDATNDIKSEITKSAEKQGIDIDITKDVRKEIDKVKEEVDEITGPIKRKF
ncbi:twin-arginine translocase TatA/TatE family subunit [Aequorivita sp. KMM 9714]|uniref:Sec-independent protein translocase subunit TatA/TatB n=1 Tax=Aequorivita sp. KMM 9714 TaxID=2707173 RepID=UPI0013EAFFEC|nr:twin-arginine translocase TatA/TatE family subunit [Aequorivita sp. KMM 9714]NGX83691.1 twin-arginine translocase TatA/TatE family subunit [Aequorivita sp. KMM 9714]